MQYRLLAFAAVAGMVWASPASAQMFPFFDDGPSYYDSPRRGYSQPRYRYRDYDDDPYFDPYEYEYERRRPQSPEVRSGGARPHIAPQAPQTVQVENNEAPGTVIIDTKARRLYYVISSNAAYSYPISVGREGFSWTGTEQVSRVAAWPDWYPPEEMRQREPHLPKRMTGGLKNPLGAKAIYLGNTLYRIHGTNDAKSIGRAASSGCFRMMNEHVLHLATLVNVGTTVKVVKQWKPQGVVTVGQSGSPS